MVPFLRCLYSCRQWTFSRPLGRCWPPVASILLAAYTAAETMYNIHISCERLITKHMEPKQISSDVMLMCNWWAKIRSERNFWRSSAGAASTPGHNSCWRWPFVFVVQLYIVLQTVVGGANNGTCTSIQPAPVYQCSVPGANGLRHMYHTPPNTVPSHLQSIKIPLVA